MLWTFANFRNSLCIPRAMDFILYSFLDTIHLLLVI
jgi:hypothetical protein